MHQQLGKGTRVVFMFIKQSLSLYCMMNCSGQLAENESKHVHKYFCLDLNPFYEMRTIIECYVMSIPLVEFFRARHPIISTKSCNHYNNQAWLCPSSIVIFNPCGFLYIGSLGLQLLFFQVKICKSGLISRWRNVSIGCVSHSWLLEVGCVYYVYYEELKFHIFIVFT